MNVHDSIFIAMFACSMSLHFLIEPFLKVVLYINSFFCKIPLRSYNLI